MVHILLFFCFIQSKLTASRVKKNIQCIILELVYRVAKKKWNSRYSRFSGLCSDQQLSFFTLLDRASFLHYVYNNTKTIKIGWELFILWVISYGLPFSGFARFPEFRGTINDSFSSKYMRQQSTHVFFNQLHVQRNLSANDVPGL